MRDEQIGQVEFSLEFEQQICDLSLNDSIQRRESFIKHDELRRQRQRSGNREPLSLSPAHFQRTPVGHVLAESHPLHQLDGTVALLSERAAILNSEGLGNNICRGKPRIHRSRCVLKNQLHARAQLAKLISTQRPDVHTVEPDLP